MKAVKRFGLFWYDFVVGHDWKLAAGAVAAIALAFFATHHGVNAWWLVPLAVAALLTVSLAHATWRASRS